MIQGHESRAIIDLANFHLVCTQAYADLSKRIVDAAYVTRKLESFAAFTTLEHSLFTNDFVLEEFPSPETLAKALAYLSIQEGVDSVVAPTAAPELHAVQPLAHKLFLNVLTLTYPSAYYQKGAWEVIRPDYLQNSIRLLENYVKASGVESESGRIETIVNRILDFEATLARAPYNASTNPSDYRLVTVAKALEDYGFIRWDIYLKVHLKML